jgi:subtilisin family serine protease
LVVTCPFITGNHSGSPRNALLGEKMPIRNAWCFKHLYLIVSISALSYAKDAKIWTGMGPIPVRPYLSTENAPALLQVREVVSKAYAFAVFTQVLDVPTRHDLESKVGIRFLGVHDVSKGIVVYRVAVTGALESVRRGMKKSSPTFLNLERIMPEDKVTRKVFNQSGFARGEQDSLTGGVHVRLEFFEDVSPVQCDSILGKYLGSKGWQRDGGDYQVQGKPETVASLANVPEISSIRELDIEFKPTNDASRLLTGVEALQSIDYVHFPPDTAWLGTDSLTGDSVTIGIEEFDGIDPSHLDFSEVIPCGTPPCPTQLRRSRFPGWQVPRRPCPSAQDACNHGTHVAAIAAGNGWMSEQGGGNRYQWRGVAPKALLFTGGKLGDVNNASHIDGTGNYGRDWDFEIWPHNHITPPKNIVVFAAGNNGYKSEGVVYGPQQGYYSLLANAKNVITVGNVQKDDTIRSLYSSMGPTRDGRIKPDIMAPGSESSPYPGRNHLHPTTFEIDYIRILDSTGAVKYGWEFNSGTEGWGLGRTLHGGWAGLERNEVSAPVHRDSVIRFQAFDLFNSYLWSDSIPALVRMGPHDSLDMRLRIIHPYPSDYASPYMAGSIFWKRLDSAVYVAGSNQVTYRFSDSNFFRIKHPFRGWTSEDTLLALRLDFQGDTAEYGIVSADTLPVGGPARHYYVKMAGTSMAAPHVTGIIALMLDKYNRTYLKPRGLNINDNAFWNSTAKAMLIHSALDLAYDGDPRGPDNPDILSHDPGHGAQVKYFPGPDFATGYGLVNAPGAIHFVDTTLFKEDSVDYAQELVYEFDVTRNVDNLRVTLAWDDYPGNPNSPPDSPKLINDLDLIVEDPQGNTYLPWVQHAPPQILPLDTVYGLPQLPPTGLDPIDSADIRPAQKGVNTLDNVEVVDVQSYAMLPRGKWRVRVKGTHVAWGPQELSLVADFPLRRDSLIVHPSDALFRYDASSEIKTRIALRALDSTIYFGAGDKSDSLLAYSIGRKALRWAYMPRPGFPFSDPVLSGNRLYLTVFDTLYCLRDDGNRASIAWTKRITPISDTGYGQVGDTSSFYYASSNYMPSVDAANNRIYLYAYWIRYRYHLIPTAPGQPPVPQYLDDSTFLKISTLDLDGNLIGQAEPFSNLNSPASSGPGGGFFSGDLGWTYKVHPQGYLLGYTNYFKARSNLYKQPILGPNGTLYVQNDSIIIASNSLTGDSLAAFTNQNAILSNFVIDEYDNLHLIGFHRQAKETRYMIYSSSGRLLVDAFLGIGRLSVGDLALGSANRAYFTLGDRAVELDYQSPSPLADARTYPFVFQSGRGSPNLGNGYVVFAGGNRIAGFPALSDGLSGGWSRSGKDNGNTGSQSLGVPGFSPMPVGTMSTVTTGSWSSSRSFYSLCGSSAGIGGVQDDFELASSYTSGDFEYAARIQLLDASHPTAKAGLMAMTETNGRSQNGFIWVSASNTAGFSKRETVNGTTSVSGALGTFAPPGAWVKLRRVGSTLYGFISQNGLHYTLLGTAAIGNGRVYVGLTHTAGTTRKTGCSEFSGIAVGSATPRALFVTGNSALAGIDTAIYGRLAGLGYQVTIKNGPESRPSDADFKDVVVISSTVTASDVGTKFRDVPVPVLSWESALSDELGMTGNSAGTDQGTLSGQTQIAITDPAHPLAGGRTGSVPVYAVSSVVSWGKPNGNAAKVATVMGDANKSVIYGYEQGTGMIGMRAPARRVGFFLENAVGIQLTPGAQSLFDNAVRWATGPVAPKAVFVVGNTALNTGDQAVYNFLAGIGFSVNVKTGPSAQAIDAAGKNLVLLSSTLTAADVGPKFAGVDAPVLNWEPLLSDDLGMTGNVQGTNQGTTASQTQVKILSAASPAAARLSGTVRATTSAQIFTWGKPNANAIPVASLASDTSIKTAFGYERGTAMISGTAPARRYELFLNDITPASLSDTGKALLNAAFAWTTGGAAAPMVPESVFGMENSQSWSSADALLSVSTNRTQGSNSIKVEGGGYMLLTSSPMRTLDISGETSNLRLDVFIPGNQPNPYWIGAVQMYAECPSAGIYNVYLGQVELTGLPENRFSSLAFTLPANVLSVLRGDFKDFVFKIALNVNEDVEPTLFDNLRFSP